MLAAIIGYSDHAEKSYRMNYARKTTQ